MMTLIKIIKHFFRFSPLFFLALGIFSNSLLYAEKTAEERVDEAVQFSTQLISEGKFDQALSVVEEVLTDYPTHAVLLTAKASVFLGAGKLNEAERISRAVLASNPDYDWPKNLLTQIKAERTRRERSEKAVERVNTAVKASTQFVSQRKFDQALLVLQEVLKEFPTHATLLAAKANAFLGAGRLNEAEKLCRKILVSNPDYDWPKSILAQIKVERKALEKAAEADEKVNVAVQFSTQLASENEFDRALSVLEDLLAEYPTHGVLLTAKANVFFHAGNFDEAEKLCRKVLEATPDYDWPMILLVQTYVEKKEYESAFQVLDQLKILKADDYSVHLLKGDLLRAQKKFEEADAEYSQAIALKDDRGSLHEVRAWNFRLMGKIDKAEEELVKATTGTKFNDRLMTVLAIHYQGRRYYKKSMKWLKNAVESCQQKGNCEGFESAYQEDFFKGTSLQGYSLSNFKIPLSFSLTDTYTAEFSNMENMLRGLQVQGADRSDENELAPPKATPKNVLKFISHLAIPNFPVINMYITYDQKFNEKDPLIEHIKHEYRIELEDTYYVPKVGDVTFFPYFQYLFLKGSNFSITDIFGESFKINAYAFGLRNLFVPRPGKTYIETELAFTAGDFAHNFRNYFEYRGRIRGTYLFDNTSQLMTEAELIRVRHDHPRNAEYRFRGTVNYDHYISRKWRALIENEFISHKDYIAGGKNINTIIYKPALGVSYLPRENVRLNNRVEYFLADVFHEYDHIGFNSEIVLKFERLFERTIADRKIKYKMPITLTVGYKAEGYHRFPRSKNKWLQTIYASLKLFW